ncbi:hypothetical protein HMPREF9123_2945 [Neisseria bacilliformis ATCC BAA-1200]|uniref:Uncharacterized protein n=1 Tax=Neisseria bacilliformis ATCC BAA-1200 TaxID=888742 RepID=F2BGT8_9NEIS|nr:hypothetical protein HMPREF9123_2945 [Neisseria bacilliformis ATCC BAA-1200]
MWRKPRTRFRFGKPSFARQRNERPSENRFYDFQTAFSFHCPVYSPP